MARKSASSDLTWYRHASRHLFLSAFRMVFREQRIVVALAMVSAATVLFGRVRLDSMDIPSRFVFPFANDEHDAFASALYRTAVTHRAYSVVADRCKVPSSKIGIETTGYEYMVRSDRTPNCDRSSSRSSVANATCRTAPRVAGYTCLHNSDVRNCIVNHAAFLREDHRGGTGRSERSILSGKHLENRQQNRSTNTPLANGM